MDLKKLIKELLELSALPKGEGLVGYTDDQLKAARDTAREIASYAKDVKNVDDLRAAVEVFEAISTELTTRSEVAAQTDAEIADLASKLSQDGEGDDANGDEGNSDDGNSSGDGDANADAPETKVEAAKELEPVAASSIPVVPDPTTPVTASADAPIVLIAGGDVKGLSAGQSMDPSMVADAMMTKANAMHKSHAGQPITVGTLEWTYPEDRFLDHEDSKARNMAKVNAVVAAAQEQTREYLDQILWEKDPAKLRSLVAAGGLCAPVNVRYELFTVGTTARPLRDSLTRFGATRGGIRFNKPPTLTDLRTAQGGVKAVNIYTEAQDASGADYPKGCIRVECTDDVEVAVASITLCMVVGNYSKMFNRESFDAWWGLGRVEHARRAEAAIWARLDTLSTNVAAGEGLGATPDTLAAVERAATQYRDRHRVDPDTPLRMRAPAFLANIMRVDMARRAPGDNQLAVPLTEIVRWFAARGIAVTWVLDGQYASGTAQYTQTAGALNPWPDSVDVNIAIDGTFLFLDGGTLDFGTEIRDFDMIKANDVGAFMETFEEVAFVGPEAEMLTLDICPDGSTAGPNTSFDPCTSGS